MYDWALELVLYCVVLCCVVLYCIVLYCNVLYPLKHRTFASSPGSVRSPNLTILLVVIKEVRAIFAPPNIFRLD